MKKLMLGLAIAAVGSAFAVESAYIVGYNTQTLTAGDYNLISLPFAGVDGGSAKLTDVMSGANWNGGETFNDGDQIQVWGFNAQGIGGYTIY